MMTKKIYIEGMSCGHCVKHVEDALMEVEGVTAAKADLKDKSAVVELSGPVEDSLLKAAVEDAGYDVTSIK